MAANWPGNRAARELGYCPCCGYRTLPEGPPGSYEVCEVCDWIDDPFQFEDIEYVSDTNHLSLRTARANFSEVGAVTESALESTRSPDGSDSRDPNWPYQAD